MKIEQFSKTDYNYSPTMGITMDQILPTFDWNESVKRCNNSPKLAEELFQMLQKELPQFHEQLAIACTQQDIKTVKQIIHKLKGTCAYPGIASTSCTFDGV